MFFFNEFFTWSNHVTNIISKASAKVGFLRRLGKRIDPLVVRDLYLCCIRPAVEYACVVWAGLSATDCHRLERLNRSAARLIARVSPSADLSHDLILAHAGILTLHQRCQAAQAKFCHRTLAGRLPPHLQTAVMNWLRPPPSHGMTRRETASSIHLPRPRKSLFRNSPLYCAFSTWNSLPSSLRNSPTLASQLLFFVLSLRTGRFFFVFYCYY